MKKELGDKYLSFDDKLIIKQQQRYLQSKIQQIKDNKITKKLKINTECPENFPKKPLQVSKNQSEKNFDSQLNNQYMIKKMMSLNNKGSEYSKLKLYDPLLENLSKKPRFVESQFSKLEKQIVNKNLIQSIHQAEADQQYQAKKVISFHIQQEKYKIIMSNARQIQKSVKINELRSQKLKQLHLLSQSQQKSLPQIVVQNTDTQNHINKDIISQNDDQASSNFESQLKQTKSKKNKNIEKESKFEYNFNNELLQVNQEYLKAVDLRTNKQRIWNTNDSSFSLNQNNNNIVGDIVSVASIFQYPEFYVGKCVWVSGWARNIKIGHKLKTIIMEINDGSSYEELRVHLTDNMPRFDSLLACKKDSSFKFFGQIKLDGQKQTEMQCCEPGLHYFKLIGINEDPKYVLANKFNVGVSLDHLRNNLQFRTRNPIYQDNFVQNIPQSKARSTIAQNAIDYTKDFYGKPVFLLQNGMAHLEAMCCSIGNVYSYGPRFQTSKKQDKETNLSELWMIETQIAHCDLFDLMECVEDFIKYCITFVLQTNEIELQFLIVRFPQFIEENGKDLIQFLQLFLQIKFERCTYSSAINILQQATSKGKQFKQNPEFGKKISSEQGLFLCEQVFKKPIFIFNLPSQLKPFCMKQNQDQSSLTFDCYFPKIGKIASGGQNEEKLTALLDQMKQKDLNLENYQFYLDLRKYGSIPHGGFQLGFERLLMLLTGQQNIRDVIPFPRAEGYCPL